MSSPKTRKECIIETEQFVRSGFKGIQITRKETPANPKSFLGKLVQDPEDKVEPKDGDYFKLRPATQYELAAADILTALMLTTQFNKRQASILFLRSFHGLSWKTLGKEFGLEPFHVRRIYDDALYILYTRMNKYRIP